MSEGKCRFRCKFVQRGDLVKWAMVFKGPAVFKGAIACRGQGTILLKGANLFNGPLFKGPFC